MASLATALMRFALLVHLMLAAIVFTASPVSANSTGCAYHCFTAQASAAGCSALSTFQDQMDCFCNNDPVNALATCGRLCETEGAWDHSFVSLCNGRVPATPTSTDIDNQHFFLARDAREKRRQLVNVREAEAEPTFKPITCTAPGITCGVTNVRGTKTVALSEVVAEIEAGALNERAAKFKPTVCTVPGLTCGKTEDKREAEAVPAPKWTPYTCTAPGITCGKDRKVEIEEKRDAVPAPEPAPVPEPVSAPEPSFTPSVCTVPGLTCGVIDDKREAEPVAEPSFTPSTCTVPGLTCGFNVPTDDDNTPKTTLKKVARLTTEAPIADATAMAKREYTDPSFDITKWLTLSYPKHTPTTAPASHITPWVCTFPGITCGIAVGDEGVAEGGSHFDHLPAADVTDSSSASSASTAAPGA